MRTKLNLILIHLLNSLFLISTVLSCGSYQTLSYYASDGIYGDEGRDRKAVEPKTNDNSVYYKNYFSNVADDYSSFYNPQKYAFTDTDNYSSNNSNGSVQINSQAPWGDRTGKTEIYFINNNPWGYINFNWGLYNSFYDPFWGYSPFFYSGFYRPYWGLSFYNPFIRFGYGFGNPFFTSRNGYIGFYGNQYNMNYAYSHFSRGSGRYANSNLLKGRHYNQGYYSSNNSRNNKYNTTTGNSNSSNTKRYNLGRKTSETSNRSNSNVTRNTNPRSNQNYRYNKRSQSNSNYSSRSSSNYNLGRSYGSSRSSYSSGGRSSSFSSGSRGSSSGGRSSSRGR